MTIVITMVHNGCTHIRVCAGECIGAYVCVYVRGSVCVRVCVCVCVCVCLSVCYEFFSLLPCRDLSHNVIRSLSNDTFMGLTSLTTM